MPVTIEINGQLVTLEDNEVQTVLRRLVSEFRQRVWLPASNSFIYRYGRWEWYYNERNHPIHWVIEAVGGADLPQAGTTRRLKRRHDQLARLMNPQSISQFFAGFNNWQRDAAQASRLKASAQRHPASALTRCRGALYVSTPYGQPELPG